MAIVEKKVGKLPVYKGDWSATYNDGHGYMVKNRVTIFGSELESLIDNNTYVPATRNEQTGVVTFEEHWKVISNGSQAYAAALAATNKMAELEEEWDDQDQRMTQMQATINAKQLEVGAVQTDEVPTENSGNHMTSGDIYQTLKNNAKGFVDDELTAGSSNLVKSNGVYKGIGDYVGLIKIHDVGVGTTAQTTPFDTIVGHVYRVYLYDGTWDVTGIGDNVTAFVIHKDGVDVPGTVILAKNIASRPEFFDVTAESGTYSIFVRAANGVEITTKIVDLSANTLYANQIKDKKDIDDLKVDSACNIEDDMQLIDALLIASDSSISDNISFVSYSIYNHGFKHIIANLYFYSAGAYAITFWSGDKIISSNFIGGVPCREGNSYQIYESDIPDNCELIVVTTVSTQRNIWVKVTDANQYLENKVNNIYSSLEGDELVLYKNNVNNGYLPTNNNTFVELPQFNNGQDVFTKVKYSITPDDILSFTNPENYAIGFWWYDKDGNYLSRDWFASVTEKTIPNDAYYCIFSFRKTGLNSNNFAGVSIRKVNISSDIKIEQGDITLNKNAFKNGYINVSDIVVTESNKIYTPNHIKVVPGADYKVISNDVLRVTVHWYDENKQFVGFDEWNILEKEFRIPQNVSYIRVTFNNTGLQVDTLTGDVKIVRVYPLPVDSIYYAGGQKEKERYITAHLFIDESVAGVNVVIPSQSLPDIAISAKLGFPQIELNVHKTSDGELICMHGSSGKFGRQVVHVDGTTDISDIFFDAVTYDWIVENVRYVSNYAKYRTTITKFEDALIACKIYGIRPSVGLNTYDDDLNKAAVELAKKYFGSNFSVGAYGDTEVVKVRKYWKGSIYNATNTQNLSDVINLCNRVGAPYTHSIPAITITDDDDLIALAKAVSEKGCKVGFAQCYMPDNECEKLVSYGWEACSPARNIPLFDCGNVGNFYDNKTFSQFTTTGTVSGGTLELASGGTIDKVLTDSVFVGGGVISVWFTGTISISIGRYISNISFTSDGKKPLVLTALYLDEVPALHIMATTSTTINSLSFKVHQFE